MVTEIAMLNVLQKLLRDLLQNITITLVFLKGIKLKCYMLLYDLIKSSSPFKL